MATRRLELGFDSGTVLRLTVEAAVSDALTGALAAGNGPAWRSIEAEEEFRRPLLDLGLTPGTPVLIVRRAPLGDPIEIFVRGCHFSIRREEANRILVEAV